MGDGPASANSAAQLGLVVDIIPLQLEPGFGHEDVVSTDPAPGTFVARGTCGTHSRELHRLSQTASGGRPPGPLLLTKSSQYLVNSAHSAGLRRAPVKPQIQDVA